MTVTLKLLIVDEAGDSLRLLRTLLQRPDIELMHAASGAEALKLVLEYEIALALIDTDMRGMDGLQLAELLRASPQTQRIPLILMAAANTDLQRFYSLPGDGALDHVLRPLDSLILRAKVETLIKLHVGRLQLTREIESMQQSLRLNEMFAAVLGHDLRSPLSAIMVSAELIIVRNKDESDVAAGLRIRDSAKRMSHLISQLIDMARVRSGHVHLLLQDCDFATVCRDVVNEIEASQKRQVQVEITGDTQGVWDPHRLSQILSNLAGNAAKHGDAQQPVRIHIDGTQPHSLVCSVQNGGVIPAELLPQIFKPFRGYDGGVGRRAGLGLGLYIVQQLVNMHGGDIAVRSSIAEGTTFTLTLKRSSGTVSTGMTNIPSQAA